MPATLGKIPDNIYAYSYVQQIGVLEHADVFLTHCGMNSVNEAMYAGVPMAAIPFINDPINNAKRIVELGLGKRVCSFPSRGRKLYQTVQEVCQSESIRQKVLEMKNKIMEQPTGDDIIESMERLL